MLGMILIKIKMFWLRFEHNMLVNKYVKSDTIWLFKYQLTCSPQHPIAFIIEAL